MEPPALTRRGDAQRISDAFHERYAGKLTTVEGIAALRHRLYTSCLDGQGGFNAALYEGLKTHITLREALEIEAVKCVAGDARHAFQEFYGQWLAEQREASKDLSKVGKLDAASLLEELQLTRRSIEEHEELLADHRDAILAGQPSPLSDEDVDATYMMLGSLRANLPIIEAEYAKLQAEESQ